MKKSTMVLKGLRTIVKWAHVEVVSSVWLLTVSFFIYLELEDSSETSVAGNREGIRQNSHKLC